ncbi:MAG: AI-2E family transporter [Limosilactobacillus oris]|jgi:predicted PurR-regulated permease PerM|uniref:AI-2E family transporter n=1 Tax=uncultured Limosilactobacillus sp. TaxID=2837629 RepID=UPI002432D037|nr:AI-2E family transporter [Limosilactobacillus oris]MCH3910214.1 AI-2E family transporter [Limosilactobacillus oris]MCH3939342.1 AI-2E family transporter [Limosilactobacillus oris]MCI1981432.1 AI-2E family transporter [Limosilactobacillus oris]MCI2043504.1 AI-2E family transporter [Limosilactobacillus oris]
MLNEKRGENVKEKYYHWLFWPSLLLVIAALIWVCTKIQFIFQPFLTFISVVFVPLILSGFLYYMLNPILKLLLKVRLGRFRLNRGVASLLLVLMLILIICGGLAMLIPPVVKEITSLVTHLPQTANGLQRQLNDTIQHSPLKNIDLTAYYRQFDHQLANYAQVVLKGLSSRIGDVINAVTNITVVTITVPVMLFYMLKDGSKLGPSIQKWLSPHHAKEVDQLLGKMNDTLSSYIAGQVIECLFVAVFTSLGYLLIHQPLALVLGIVAGLCNIIPYIGPYIGIAPALFVSLTMAPQKLILVIIVVIVVQQIDGNVIYPNIIGKTLQIHPLTIILLLLAAGHIAGIAGMILCIPFYAVLKTIAEYFFDIYRIEHPVKDETKE